MVPVRKHLVFPYFRTGTPQKSKTRQVLYLLLLIIMPDQIKVECLELFWTAKEKSLQVLIQCDINSLWLIFLRLQMLENI